MSPESENYQYYLRTRGIIDNETDRLETIPVLSDAFAGGCRTGCG